MLVETVGYDILFPPLAMNIGPVFTPHHMAGGGLKRQEVAQLVEADNIL